MFDAGMFGGGLGSALKGLFGDSGAPYDKAMEEFQKWMNQAQGAQQPYAEAGKRGLANYEDWLGGQKDPAAFMNNLMGQYQESPYAHNLQQQSMNAGQNAASASGLMGSTPMMQQLQQNAGNIASQDQNNWLQHVLGINTQYGQGQNNLREGGQQSANHLTDLFSKMGEMMGQGAFGKEQGKQNDFWNMLGGIGGMFGGLGF